MKTTIKYLSLGLAVALGLASCSDEFLEEKRDYDRTDSSIYNTESGCQLRINDLYAWCLPIVGDITTAANKNFPISMGNNDIAGGATEEYSGFPKNGDNWGISFVNEAIELSSISSTNAVPDFFMGTQANIQQSVYGRIRNINDAIKGISESTISEDSKDKFLGQAYFFRAWCYYNLMKWYGGVPIVTTVLDPVAKSFTPRSSAEETKNFILSDLENAAVLLGGGPAEEYGRVTTGTALALKGRVLLLWASPLFNRANDPNRWTEAYAEMSQDLPLINACGYGLYQTGNNVNGSDFAMQFCTSARNPEAVFVTLYNNIASEESMDNQKNNRWERDIRPSNTGAGGKGAGLMLIQQFPMADGKIPAGTGTYTKLATSSYSYDADCPFMNRDPRFYRTFGFPGFRWAYNGNASLRDPNNPSDGKNYTLWNYVWYTDTNDQGNPESGNSYGSDNLLKSKQGVYVRKKSDDLDLNTSPLYNYQATYTKGAAPFFSAAPLMELRYAEVLLNLAEVACGAGNVSAALQYLNQVRQRAGVPDRTSADFIGDEQAACMSAILYERQIEFAYEGKRFDDMRRWMLFDGGAVTVPGAPSSWTLTGWGGNTCTWLGFKQMNGQRRERIEFRTADSFGVGTEQWNSDPLLKDALQTAAGAYHATHPDVTVTAAKNIPEVFYAAAAAVRPEGVDLRNELGPQLETLKAWYQANLVTSIKRGDGYNSDHMLLFINFRPKYYFLGFSQGASSANKGLPQMIGWEDYNTGGMGTYDPFEPTSYWTGE